MSSLSCCAGFVDSGIPKGEIVSVNGVKCYIAPKNDNFQKDTLIVIGTDIFGFTLPNVRLIADNFAKEANCLCVIPDVFNGTEVPAQTLPTLESLSNPNASIFSKFYAVLVLLWYGPWFLFRNPKSKGADIIEKVILEYKTKYGITKVGMQGYCWGGSLSLILGQRNKLLNSFCAAHPGGFNIPKDISKLSAPVCFVLTPDLDLELKHKQCDEIEKELREKKNMDPNYVYELKRYKNMKHGFAVRGDENNSEVAQQRKTLFGIF